MLSAESVVAFIARLVSPRLNPVPMLQVVFPHTLVLGPIHVLVNTASVGLVVGPVAIVDITVDMNKTTFAMSTILSPFTAIPGPIVPRLLTEAVSEATFPLTGVNSARFKCIRRALLSLLIRAIQVLGNCLTGLFLCEILAASELLGSQH